MLQTIINAFKIADLRKKLLFTGLILLIFRIGSAIPVPFLDSDTFGVLANTGLLGADQQNTFLGYLSMMTGDAFNYGTIFAMGITPYINSSIIMQLLTVAIPALERLQKEGEEGRKKIASITRYVTVGLGLLQSTAYYFYVRSKGYLAVPVGELAGTGTTGFPGGWGVFQAFIIILCFTAGTALIMWLGEQINDKGVGNGISLILFAGIVARLPQMITQLFSTENGYLQYGGPYWFLSPLAAILYLLMIAYIVFMDSGERRIPVQYAKRVVGRKMYGGQSTHIPIKVNMGGVMPIIFASSILSLPPTIQMFVQSRIENNNFWKGFFEIFSQTHWVYGIFYFVLIIGFAYFYASIQYNPIEMSNNIRKQSGTIPGIRPGDPTAQYIRRILSKLTLLGALMISVVAIFPVLFSQLTTLFLTKVFDFAGGGFNISLGGTSIIILVGVALETVKQLESQMMMRHYRGFLD
ncbi:MAG: preprotein translocase subunit SecY [Oscillospiraceae bacterium]|nr:preprotein translocase subunit SecY [Oscillospiraceae bacterium]